MAELPDFRPKGGSKLPDFRPQQFGSDPALARREGESEEAYANRLVYGEPERKDAGKLDAFVRGTGDALWLGGMDEAMGGVGWLMGDGYEATRDAIRADQRAAAENHPGTYLAGEVTGSILPVIATGGMAAPATAVGRLGANVAAGTAYGTAYGFGSADGDMGDRLAGGAEGAAWGAGLGLLPSAAEGIWKGGKALINNSVRNVQKVTNPKVAAEKELVRQMVKDWKANAKLEARALSRGQPSPPRRFLNEDDVVAAEGAGQRTMVSDIGGDATRRKLKAADNVSEYGSVLMRGAAGQRQVDSGSRVTQVVGDTFGDVNPKSIADDLRVQARAANDAAYAAAEAHPNAVHMWNPVLQRALSTSAGKKALKNAIAKSRDKALRNGEDVVEPEFIENADGLMEFSGQFRRPNGQPANIQGLGLNLRFWDSVKRSMQDDVDELLRAGRKDDASDIIAVKNEMVGNLDQAVPDYKNARSTAAEFFGKGDAHEAGAEYLKNMNAFDIAEARAALQRMSPPERELFARGYAAELVTKISTMGEAENVAKLFKSPQARMKMRDALGDGVTDQLEAFTHREVVQGMLGRHLGANSTTAQQLIAAEGLKLGASGGAGYYATGDYTGLLAGLAMRGGYRFTQRKVVERYAREMAELAISEDPAVISRILTKVSQDPGYMAFSRSVAGGASGGGGAFADGGRVRLAGGDLVGRVARKLLTPNRSTVKHPVRKAFPGIYKEPRALLEDVQIEPESPALKRLFGVTRDDLYEISKRKGNVDDILNIEGKTTRGSPATDNIKTPRNAQRLVNALEVARTNEDLWKGMHGWYTMDPAYQQLVRDYGPEEGARLFRRFNTLTGMSSPGSEVMTELQRGTAANMMDNLGLFDDFLRHGGTGKDKRGQGFPQELEAVDGHPYHSTSQAPAMDNYLRTGRVEMGSAKVPTYIGASTPPELGNFTNLPIADAHFTRAVGLPDTRTAEKVFDHSMTMGEYKSVAPWYRDRVASQAGLEGVPAQAIHWGLFGPQTGVTTPVGAPKLELLARGIMETARRLGISPEKARDLVLTGKAHAFEQGGLVSALGAAAH